MWAVFKDMFVLRIFTPSNLQYCTFRLLIPQQQTLWFVKTTFWFIKWLWFFYLCRFDDPLLLERYRMLQPPYLPFAPPGMLHPTGVHPLLASGRYPPELLHQQYPFASSASRLQDHISSSLSERSVSPSVTSNGRVLLTLIQWKEIFIACFIWLLFGCLA